LPVILYFPLLPIPPGFHLFHQFQEKFPEKPGKIIRPFLFPVSGIFSSLFIINSKVLMQKILQIPTDSFKGTVRVFQVTLEMGTLGFFRFVRSSFMKGSFRSFFSTVHKIVNFVRSQNYRLFPSISFVFSLNDSSSKSFANKKSLV